MVVVPAFVADGVTSPPVLMVAIDTSLLVHAFPNFGLMVHVAVGPPVHRDADPIENPIGVITWKFTVTTAVMNEDDGSS